MFVVLLLQLTLYCTVELSHIVGGWCFHLKLEAVFGAFTLHHPTISFHLQHIYSQ